MKAMNKKIAAMFAKLADTSFKTDKQEEKPQRFHPKSQLMKTA